MRKHLLTLFAVAAPALLLAQSPVLNQWNMPRVGFTRVDYVADTVGITAGAAGANVTWDFTGLIKDANNAKVETPIILPSATKYASNFPTANAAANTAQGNYAFMNIGTNQVEMVGYAATIQGEEVIQKFTDPMIQMKIPFEYNDAFTDKFAAEYTANDVDFEREGTLTAKADAYGTLKMPGITANNVLRIHAVTYQKDSGNIFTMAFEMITESESWSFVVPGRLNPVLTIMHTTVTSMMDGQVAQKASGKSVMFNTEGGVSAIEKIQAATALQLYPNPAKNNSQLSFHSEINAEATVTVLNLLGQQAMPVKRIFAAKGTNQTNLDLNNLQPGIYLVQLSINGNSAVQKLIVQ